MSSESNELQQRMRQQLQQQQTRNHNNNNYPHRPPRLRRNKPIYRPTLQSIQRSIRRGSKPVELNEQEEANNNEALPVTDDVDECNDNSNDNNNNCTQQQHTLTYNVTQWIRNKRDVIQHMIHQRQWKKS